MDKKLWATGPYIEFYLGEVPRMYPAWAGYEGPFYDPARHVLLGWDVEVALPAHITPEDWGDKVYFSEEQLEKISLLFGE